MLNGPDSDDHDDVDVNIDGMSDAEGDHAQDLDEDVENSDIFDTDSSDEDPGNEPQILNELPVDLSQLQAGVQKDQDATDEEKPEEETQREEMDGILVYDAYARMMGCEKIENYFEENQI